MKKLCRMAATAAAVTFMSMPPGLVLAQNTPETGAAPSTATTPAPAETPAAAPPPAATTTTPAAAPTATTTTEPAKSPKKKRVAKMNRRQEIDKSIERGTVPSRYRNSVPKEYQQYIPFEKQ
jgi:hypothetical protein